MRVINLFELRAECENNAYVKNHYSGGSPPLKRSYLIENLSKSEIRYVVKIAQNMTAEVRVKVFAANDTETHARDRTKTKIQ